MTDLAGNTSSLSSGFDVTIDITAPIAPVISSITTDSGSSSSDGVTNDQTLVFTGTAEANSSLELFVGGASVATVTTNGTGSWTYDYTGTTLSEGSYTFTAKATDAAGNTSVASSDFDVEIDITNPGQPTIASINNDSGSSSTDEITNDNTLTFNGTAEANSTIELFQDGVSKGTTNHKRFWCMDI